MEGISPIAQVEWLWMVPYISTRVGAPKFFFCLAVAFRDGAVLLLRWQPGRGRIPELPPALPHCFFHTLCQVSVVYDLGLSLVLL